MKFTTFFIFLVTLAVCLTSFSFFKRSYADIARGIRGKVGKELAKKHQMYVAGVGGGMMGCVREIALSFQVRRILSQDEARCIIVDCVETILKAFNENEKIRPHLLNYPFTTTNLDVRIFISNPQGYNVYYPDFCIVSVYNEDVITYKREDHNGKSLPSILEPYQEALVKVKEGCQVKSLSASY